jgi:hypothetical protein
VLLLNNDVTVDPGFLAAMVAAASTDPNLAAACPKAYFRDRPDVIYSTGGRVNLWTGTARQIGRGERDRGRFGSEAVRDYADGLCMLIPAAAVEKVGLLDEEYFNYWEETDWCFRARKRAALLLRAGRDGVAQGGAVPLIHRRFPLPLRAERTDVRTKAGERSASGDRAAHAPAGVRAVVPCAPSG